MLARSIQKYYIFVLLFLLAILQSSCQQSGNKYRILVVHSYESDYVAYKDCDRLIRKSLEKKGINPSIQTFYLNCEQYYMSNVLKQTFGSIIIASCIYR